MPSTRNENDALLIPAYNTAQTMRPVLDAVSPFFRTIVVVDDGSTDDSAKIAADCGVVVLRHGVNKGKGAALKTGFGYLHRRGVELIMTMDADGQHSARDIPRLWLALEEQDEEQAPWGIVIGSRFASRELIPPYRYYPNRCGQIILSGLTGQTLEDTQSGFRIYRTCVLQQLVLHTDRFETETEVIIKTARLGYRILFVPIETIYPENERQKTNFKPILDTYRISIMVLRELLSRFSQKVKP
ncbi:glycosyltransferase family 2 protein [candidate division CSSED10-310 bacterium]|uniref:Glycosyltransferase family 2 protein n=1 Tax=candidate division CSSED10-310 bacterium TaxID=2855610 RepID=A0ABV6YRB9_UNCC1